MTAVSGSDFIALVLLVTVLAGWVAVQSAWRRTFPEVGPDPDVLAARERCSGCKTECKRSCSSEEVAP